MTKEEVERLDPVEFCRIDEEELETSEDFVKYLWSMIYNPNCYYNEFNDSVCIFEGKRHVDYVGNLKIVIQSAEHAPPHFEVIFDNSKACFRLDNGLPFKGKMRKPDIKKIRDWYRVKKNRQKLIDMWNESRPFGCVVGEYRGV
jgi:hypothetical protein